MEEKKDEKPVKTRREIEPEKHRKLTVERHRRRAEIRKAAKKNGHKLGQRNRKCKLCTLTRAEGWSGKCDPKKVAEMREEKALLA